MLKCPGCEDFRCAVSVDVAALSEADGECVKQWLVMHKLVFRRVLCSNHAEPAACILREETWHCPKRECRHKCNMFEPLLDGYARCSPPIILEITLFYALGMSQVAIQQVTHVNIKSVRKVVHNVEELLARYSDLRVVEIHEDGGRKALQVDETAFSQRKYHRGKRVRAEGCEWVQTVAITKKDGGSLEEIVMTPVSDRRAATLEANIDAVANRHCLVRSDGWRGYRHLGRKYGHAVVIHQIGFVAEDKTHTNGAECANSMVKRELRCRGGQLGQNSADRMCRVKAISQICNSKLEKKAVFVGILQRVRTVCEAGNVI